MSDEELRALRQKKLHELQERLESREEKTDTIDSDKILNKVLKGRAWEVFNAASLQFPDVMKEVKRALVELVLAGKIREIDGEQLFSMLQSLNLRVRLNTEIKFLDHGKLKSLAEQLKDNL